MSSRSIKNKKRWMDVSIPLKNGMVHWPHDPRFHIERKRDMKRGDECNVSTLTLGSHTGTHMDAPLHFIQKGKGLDQMTLDTAMGPARVIEIKDPLSIRPEAIRSYRLRRGERILFKTRNSNRCWKTNKFIKDFVSISEEAAEYLAHKKIRLVGIDYLSVGGYKESNGVEVHRILLRAGIWIVEGLNLTDVRPGKYDLVCLPLKVVHGDGAPARVILRAG